MSRKVQLDDGPVLHKLILFSLLFLYLRSSFLPCSGSFATFNADEDAFVTVLTLFKLLDSDVLVIVTLCYHCANLFIYLFIVNMACLYLVRKKNTMKKEISKTKIDCMM